MKRRIYITESQLNELSEKTEYTSDGGTILYRVNRNGLEQDFAKSKFGLFFTDDLGYYSSSDQATGYKASNAVKYELSPNAKIWNPVKELDLDVSSWTYITGKEKDFEKYGIEDECGWVIPEGYAVTSTDGLAIAGLKLGYDGIVVEKTAYITKGDYANEYIIYNPQVIKQL